MTGFSQSPASIPQSCVFMDVDVLGQTYILTDSGTLYKYDAEGHESATFSDSRWGIPASLDVMNPQKILLHYPDFNKAVLLDGGLASVKWIDLEQTGMWNIKVLGLSSDGYIWTFDMSSQRVIKMDDQGNRMVESDPVNYIVDWGAPDRLIERNNHLYYSVRSKGWVVLDRFAQVSEIIPQPHRWFTVTSDGQLTYWNEDQLFRWSPKLGLPSNLRENVRTWHDMARVFLTD